MNKSNLLKDESVKEIKTKHSLKNLYEGFKIPWLKIILGLIFSAAAMLLLATQVGNASLIQMGQHQDLKPLLIYTIVYIINCGVFYFSVIGDKALVTITTKVRKKMWAKIVRIDVRDLEKESPSSLLSRITNDSELASKPFTIITIVISVITFIMGLAGKLKELDLAMFGPFIIIGVIVATIVAFLSVKTINIVSTVKQNKISDLTKFYSEQLSDTNFIKASNGEEKTVDKALRLIDERYKAEKDYAKYLLLNALTSSVLQFTLFVTTFVSGIIFLKSGVINDLSHIAKFYTSFTVICGGLINIVVLPQVFSETIGGTKKLGYVFNMENEDLSKGEKLEINDINLNNVSFKYEDKPTIDHTNMLFEKGKVTAIVGPNGSGKSTIIKLLSRLYKANEGNITVGDKSFEAISLKSWRENFSVVSQNASLFSGTIKENILYGVHDEISAEKLNKAIEVAGLTDLVKEKGLDYNIGFKGHKLSGGEQQRLAIARAFITDKEYLILDEATANLDVRTETKVIDLLLEAMKDKTIIIIAHTIEVINKADNIIVLRDGKVEAQGKKDDMIRNNSFVKIMTELGD